MNNEKPSKIEAGIFMSPLPASNTPTPSPKPPRTHTHEQTYIHAADSVAFLLPLFHPYFSLQITSLNEILQCSQ